MDTWNPGYFLLNERLCLPLYYPGQIDTSQPKLEYIRSQTFKDIDREGRAKVSLQLFIWKKYNNQ